MLIKTDQIKHLKEGILYRHEENNWAESKDEVDKQMIYGSLHQKLDKAIRNTWTYLFKNSLSWATAPEILIVSEFRIPQVSLMISQD